MSIYDDFALALNNLIMTEGSWQEKKLEILEAVNLPQLEELCSWFSEDDFDLEDEEELEDEDIELEDEEEEEELEELEDEDEDEDDPDLDELHKDEELSAEELKQAMEEMKKNVKRP